MWLYEKELKESEKKSREMALDIPGMLDWAAQSQPKSSICRTRTAKRRGSKPRRSSCSIGSCALFVHVVRYRYDYINANLPYCQSPLTTMPVPGFFASFADKAQTAINATPLAGHLPNVGNPRPSSPDTASQPSANQAAAQGGGKSLALEN